MAARKTSKRKSSARKSRSIRNPFFTSILRWVFVVGIWVGIIGLGITAWYASELPDITKDATFEPKISITVKAADGSVIARYGEIRGDALTVENMPEDLVNAVLSIEDRRFYYHFGVDPFGLLRAMFVNAKAGHFVQGGSTITQQLAKNLFLSQERTMKRKIQEALLAIWLEQQLTKDEILSAYLNRVYLGSGTFGVSAAARVYFNKSVKNLTLRESATLAGLLKAPSRYSPLNNPGLSKQRTEIVLHAMHDAGYITEEEAGSMKGKPPVPTEKPVGGNSVRYYTDWIVDGLDDLIGTPSENIIIETTLNPKIQNVAEETLSSTILANGVEKKMSQGAVVVMRPDGAVVAMAGGVDYALSQFNRATQAKRQPGSSFKPFVYLTALEHGWDRDDMVVDEPITTGRYRPQNFGGEYYGEISLEGALTLSLNTVSYQLIKQLGPAAVIDTARRMGIYSPLPEDLSLALGTANLSLLEITTGYAVIANGGMSVYPYAINRIIDESGELYYQRPPGRASRRVVDGYHIQTLASMMESVVQYGTGQAAKQSFPVAGKTGTSQDSRDAWFIGFSDQLVTGVWVGNDDNSPTKGITGGSYPARIWSAVMSRARGQYAPVDRGSFISSSFQSLMSRMTGGGYEPQNSGTASRTGNEEIYWRDENSPPPTREQLRIPENARYND
jgi:penicillin-binding protein 1A